MTDPRTSFDDITFTARDGLRLYARRYRAATSRPAGRPVVCIAGLTRNGRDFHDIATALSRGADARDVYTVDYRGRGLSDHDPDWRNYAVPIEMLDVMDFMTSQGLRDAAMLGTSRGGLIAMVLGAAQPSLIGAVVLNDIGPVIEARGLGRISAYVGRVPLPGSWQEAAKLVSDMNRKAFPAVPEDQWESFARQLFNERNGRPAPGYDPKLANALSVLDGPMPELWPQFDALKRMPVMVIRGEKSDILSEETVEAMRRRHPRFVSYLAPGEGHAPLLKDAGSIGAVRGFLAKAELSEAAPARVYA